MQIVLNNFHAIYKITAIPCRLIMPHFLAICSITVTLASNTLAHMRFVQQTQSGCVCWLDDVPYHVAIMIDNLHTKTTHASIKFLLSGQGLFQTSDRRL